MKEKSKTMLVSVGTVLGLAVGGGAILNHLDPVQLDQHNRQEQVEQAADAQERTNEQHVEDGKAAGDAEHQRRLVPGELRPEEPRLRLRLRP